MVTLRKQAWRVENENYRINLRSTMNFAKTVFGLKNNPDGYSSKKVRGNGKCGIY
jgi:hypothetical protein